MYIGAAAPRLPDSEAARLLAYERPGDYDTLTHAFQFFRRMIVEALPLHPGDVVLDVGCGTGLCFSMLLEKVGPRGRIVGIDVSPVMMAAARERMVHAGWRNITLVQSSLIEAQIPLRADAALFGAVHDILRSPQALHTLAPIRPLPTGCASPQVGQPFSQARRVVVKCTSALLRRGVLYAVAGAHFPSHGCRAGSRPVRATAP